MINIEINAVKKHKIGIGRDILKDCGKYIKWVHEPCRVMVITDDEVDELYGETVSESLKAEGFFQRRFIFDSGEQNKSIQMVNSIYEALADNEFDRNDIVIALGGGVPCDVAGFVAATYARGIEYIQIPTNLTAMTDAAIGGKNDVETAAGQGMVGTFWMPSLVLCDLDTLDTMPEDVYMDGIAEAIKYSIISGNEMFSLFEDGIDPEKMEEIVEKCINIKKEYVEKDVYDQHIRKMLNLGRTIGNAVEAASGYSITHGQALAMGIVAMARIHDVPCMERLEKAFAACGFEDLDIDFEVEELLPYVAAEKKNGEDFIVTVIPKEIGICELERLPLDDLEEKLEVICI